MFADLKAVFDRSRHTILQDAAGGAALMFALVATLQWPGLF